MTDVESLLRYHREYELPDISPNGDIRQTIFDDLLLLPALNDERAEEVISNKTHCWLSMYASSVYSVFKVKLFLSLGVVLAHYSENVTVSMLGLLERRGIVLWQYAGLELPKILEEQIGLFVSKLESPKVRIANGDSVTLANMVRWRCEQTPNFSRVGQTTCDILLIKGILNIFWMFSRA